MPTQLRISTSSQYTANAVYFNGQLFAAIPRTIEGPTGKLTLNGVMVPCTEEELLEAKPNISGRNVLTINGELYLDNAVALSEDGKTLGYGGYLKPTSNRIAMGPGWETGEDEPQDRTWHFEPASASASFDGLGIVYEPYHGGVRIDSARKGAPKMVKELTTAWFYRNYIANDSYVPPYPDRDKICHFYGQGVFAGSYPAFPNQNVYVDDVYWPGNGTSPPAVGFTWNTGAINVFSTSESAIHLANPSS